MLKGFPDWSSDPRYTHIFSDLEKVVIDKRPPTLPTLYKYTGSAIHPVRHTYAEGELPSTYIYIFDSSPEGIKYAQEVSLIQSVPYGPVKDMSNYGMVLSFLTMYAYTYDRTQVFFNCIQAIGLWQENFRERVTPKMT